MALAPEIASFGDANHQASETGLTISGGGFGAFAGRVLMCQNADGTGLLDVLTVNGPWNDIEIAGIDIPASPNNASGTVYAIVEREDLAWSQGFAFTLAAGQFLQSLAGSIVSSGVIAKRTARALLGSIASAGALSAVTAVLFSIAASLSSAGTLTKRTGKAASGAVTSTGALTRSISRTLIAAIASAGALQSLKASLISLSGALSGTGELMRRVDKSLAGSIASAGSIVKSIALNLAGALASAGELSSSGLTPAITEPPASRTIRVRSELR